MANRVLLDENGLKISRPGIDVLTASPANLLFRSDATNVPRWDQGSLAGSASVHWDNGAIYYYGRTFATIPIVTWSRQYQGEVINGTGTCINQGGLAGFTNSAWIVKPERNRLFFNSPNNTTLYFKVWDYEA